MRREEGERRKKESGERRDEGRGRVEERGGRPVGGEARGERREAKGGRPVGGEEGRREEGSGKRKSTEGDRDRWRPCCSAALLTTRRETCDRGRP